MRNIFCGFWYTWESSCPLALLFSLVTLGGSSVPLCIGLSGSRVLGALISDVQTAATRQAGPIFWLCYPNSIILSPLISYHSGSLPTIVSQCGSTLMSLTIVGTLIKINSISSGETQRLCSLDHFGINYQNDTGFIYSIQTLLCCVISVK